MTIKQVEGLNEKGMGGLEKKFSLPRSVVGE
jgi:hypothetical protein